MDEATKARLDAYQRALTAGVVEHFDALPDAASDIAAAVCRHLTVDKEGRPAVVDRFGDPVPGVTVADIVARQREACPEAFRKAEKVEATAPATVNRHQAEFDAFRSRQREAQLATLESMMKAGNPTCPTWSPWRSVMMSPF